MRIFDVALNPGAVAEVATGWHQKCNNYFTRVDEKKPRASYA
jgi:hypothetical protein